MLRMIRLRTHQTVIADTLPFGQPSLLTVMSSRINSKIKLSRSELTVTRQDVDKVVAGFGQHNKLADVRNEQTYNFD